MAASDVPFAPKGDSAGQTNERTDGQRVWGLNFGFMYLYYIQKDNVIPIHYSMVHIIQLGF